MVQEGGGLLSLRLRRRAGTDPGLRAAAEQQGDETGDAAEGGDPGGAARQQVRAEDHDAGEGAADGHGDQHPAAGAGQPLAVGVVGVVARQAHEQRRGEQEEEEQQGAGEADVKLGGEHRVEVGPGERRHHRREDVGGGEPRRAAPQGSGERDDHQLAGHVVPHPDPGKQEAAEVHQHAEQDEGQGGMDHPAHHVQPQRGERLGRAPQPPPVEGDQDGHQVERQQAEEEKPFLPAQAPRDGPVLLDAGPVGADVGDGDRAEEDRHPEGRRQDPPLVNLEPGPGPQPQEDDARPRDHQPRGHQRQQDEPVEEQVAQEDRHQRPGVGGEQPHLGAHVAAEAPQVLHRLRLGIDRRGRLAAELVLDELDGAALLLLRLLFLRQGLPAHPLDPAGQPAPQIAAARDGGQEIELLEQAVAGEPLDDAEAEGGAADAAAREAERGAADAVAVEPGVEVLDHGGVELPAGFLGARFARCGERRRVPIPPRLEVRSGDRRLERLAFVLLHQDVVQREDRARHELPSWRSESSFHRN